MERRHLCPRFGGEKPVQGGAGGYAIGPAGQGVTQVPLPGALSETGGAWRSGPMGQQASHRHQRRPADGPGGGVHWRARHARAVLAVRGGAIVAEPPELHRPVANRERKRLVSSEGGSGCDGDGEVAGCLAGRSSGRTRNCHAAVAYSGRRRLAFFLDFQMRRDASRPTCRRSGLYKPKPPRCAGESTPDFRPSTPRHG